MAAALSPRYHNGTLKVWDLQAGTELATLSGHTGWVRAVAVTPDDRWVVSVSDNRRLKVWDLRDGMLPATFTAEGQIRSGAVAQDGVTIVAAEESGQVHIVRLEGIKRLGHTPPMSPERPRKGPRRR